MLRRNNIIPTQEHRNLGCGGGGGGSYGGGGSSLTGNHAGGTSAGTRGMAGTQELKAVLELGMRDSVRRLLKQVERGLQWQHTILCIMSSRLSYSSRPAGLFSKAFRHDQRF